MDKLSAPAGAAAVVVVGSINMDMLAHSRRLPAPGETLEGERFVMAPGGKGANQAVAAARLGAAVAFVSRVGVRQHGQTLLDALGAEGVDLRGVTRDPDALPGIAVIMVASEGGENSIVYVPGSNADLGEADIDAQAALLSGARVVVAQLEVPLPAVRRAFEIARAAGVTTILNAAPAVALDETMLGLCSWLVLNETEAAQLGGLSPDAAQGELAPEELPALAQRAAQALHRRGAARVAVTLGAQGVLMSGPEGVAHLPARAVRAVDTVGAGDTFVGGLAAGLAEGLGDAGALRLGLEAAAIAVSRPGVQSAMPRRDEIGEA